METKFKEGDKVVISIQPSSDENKVYDGKEGIIIGHHIIRNVIYNIVRFKVPVGGYNLFERSIVDEDLTLIQ